MEYHLGSNPTFLNLYITRFYMKNFFEFGYTYDILYDVIEKNIKIKLFFASRGLKVNS
jgi:hypothetical protein